MLIYIFKWFKNLRIRKIFYFVGGIIVKSIWVKIIGKSYESNIIVGV